MEDIKKTKKQLIEELEKLRGGVADVYASAIDPAIDQIRISHNLSKTEEEYRDLKILNTIAQAIHRSLDLQEVYDIALNMTTELDNVDMAFIYMIEKSGDEKAAVLCAHRNLSESYISNAGRIAYPKGVTWKVINSGKILNIENIQNDKNIGPAGRELGHHSVLGIPIISDTETIGVVWFCSFKEQVFDDKDVELLSTIGNHISVAIAKTKLYEQLSKTKRYEEIIKTVTQSVHKLINLQDVFENAVEAMNENVDLASNVSIFMAEGKHAVLKSYRGFPDWFMQKIKAIPYPEGFTWKTIIEGKVIYCPDVDKDKVIGAAGRKLGTKSYISIPISDEEMAVGCLNLHSYEKNGFGEEEIKLLQTISDQIGVAISNARQASTINEAKARLSGILEISEDAIISVNEMQNIILFNKGAEKIFGYQRGEVIGKSLDILIPEHFVKYHYRHVEEFSESTVSARPMNERRTIYGLRKNGEEFPAEATISKLQTKDEKIFTLILRDITERERLEEELIKSQKLESLGVLAGGIAHDFNNLFTAIQGNISLAKLDVRSENEETINILDNADRACERAMDLTNQLLTFSKGGAPITALCSIEPIIREAAKFALTGSNVKSEIMIQKSIARVEIDKGQIFQVLQNIIINADQAMPGGGIIRLNAEDFTAGDNKNNNLLKDGNCVKISIEDAGIGIPQELIHKIFDPFFTTKHNGSGLGLAISYAIIKNHGGEITVESEIDKGTIFNIYLPASEKAMSSARQDGKNVVNGKGRILIMDDDRAISILLKKLLTRLGYEIETSADGSQAIELYKKAIESGRVFDIVILDLTVPGGMGGKETIEVLLEIDPTVKGIVTSGYSNDPVMSNYKKFGFKSYIAKPFDLRTLGKILDSVVDDREA